MSPGRDGDLKFIGTAETRRENWDREGREEIDGSQRPTRLDVWARGSRLGMSGVVAKKPIYFSAGLGGFFASSGSGFAGAFCPFGEPMRSFSSTLNSK